MIVRGEKGWIKLAILILKAIAVNKDRAYLVLRSDLDLQV